MNKLISFIALSSLTALSPPSFADALGLHVGAGQWQSDYSGSVGETSLSMSELGYNKITNNTFYVAFEHPIPLIPNLRFDGAVLQDDSQVTLSQDFQLDNVYHTAGNTLQTKLDITQYDGTLYYEVLDNWVSLDLGLSVRKFDGKMQAISPGTPLDSADIDGYLPLLYSRAKIELPFTGLSIGAHAQGIEYSGDTVTDLSANIAYMFDTSVIDLGIELGYRQEKLELSDLDALNSDITLEGPYASVLFHF